MRKRFVELLARVFKVQLGSIWPKWIMVLFLYPLYPLRAFWDTNPWFSYDIMTNTLDIDGTKFSLSSLRRMARSDVGMKFIIEEKKDHIITFRRI